MRNDWPFFPEDEEPKENADETFMHETGREEDFPPEDFYSGEDADVYKRQIFPFFVLFFVLASVVTTVFHLPAAVTSPLKELSKFLIIMAMAAIGLNTNIVKLVKTGGKPILTGLCCWVCITAVSLGMQAVLGIW